MKAKMTLAAALYALAVTPALAGVVVVGKDSPIGSVDADEAKRIFLGHEPSLAGQTLTVLYQKDGATRSDFEGKVLGKSGAELAAYWSKLIFTGKATAPDELAGDAAVKAKLAGNPAAIGYISDGAVDGSVKVIFKY